jgi:uncharacterized paraquat-inducible protein A
LPQATLPADTSAAAKGTPAVVASAESSGTAAAAAAGEQVRPYEKNVSVCHVCETVIATVHATCTRCHKHVHARKQCRKVLEEGPVCSTCAAGQQ